MSNCSSAGGPAMEPAVDDAMSSLDYDRQLDEIWSKVDFSSMTSQEKSWELLTDNAKRVKERFTDLWRCVERFVDPENGKPLTELYRRMAVEALDYTNQGLETFVEDETNDMHNNIQDQLSSRGRGCTCEQCTTEEIVKPTKYKNYGKKPPRKAYRPCPNSVCDEYANTIIRSHRYEPTWRNTDATKWSSDAWALAKCFLPPGQGNSRSARETGLSEKLNIIINNRNFQAKLSENMSNDNNVFVQARTIRNKVCHSGSDTMTKDELNNMLDLLIRLLSDGKFLANHQPAIEAVEKLKQLKEIARVMYETMSADEEQNQRGAKRKCVDDIRGGESGGGDQSSAVQETFPPGI